MEVAKEQNIACNSNRISAKSYIQDGLVAMWDGIENFGYGIHDPASMVWKDLVGGVGDFCMFMSGTKSRLTIPMENDGLFYYSDGTQYMAAPDANGILLKVFLDKFTLEYVRKARATQTNEITYGLSYHGQYRTEDRFGISYNSWKRDCNPPFNAISQEALLSGVNTCHREYGDNASIMVNNQLVKTSETEVRLPYYQAQADIFENGQVSFKCFASWTGKCENGNVMNDIGIGRIAIYNRPLTDEEATHNYELDKMRFGI